MFKIILILVIRDLFGHFSVTLTEHCIGDTVGLYQCVLHVLYIWLINVNFLI